MNISVENLYVDIGAYVMPDPNHNQVQIWTERFNPKVDLNR